MDSDTWALGRGQYLVLTQYQFVLTKKKKKIFVFLNLAVYRTNSVWI